MMSASSPSISGQDKYLSYLPAKTYFVSFTNGSAQFVCNICNFPLASKKRHLYQVLCIVGQVL